MSGCEAASFRSFETTLRSPGQLVRAVLGRVGGSFRRIAWAELLCAGSFYWRASRVARLGRMRNRFAFSVRQQQSRIRTQGSPGIPERWRIVLNLLTTA